jgi:hypothetical protein
MFQKLKDRLHYLWEGRFKHGVGLGLGGLAYNKYANGAFVVTATGPSISSPGTGHWPWFVCEAARATGAKPSWHIGILGCTWGMVIVNDYDKKLGEIVGPDKSKYYFFFKGINHKQQDFEEIIL